MQPDLLMFYKQVENCGLGLVIALGTVDYGISQAVNMTLPSAVDNNRLLKSYVKNCLGTISKKNISKNIFVEKTYSIRKVGGGRGVRQGSKKKKASVGLFSTFRHPLAVCTT